jgi:hypothetical protein
LSALKTGNNYSLRVYRRCRQMLSIVLGIAPSAETETLRRSIDQAQ